MSTPVVPTLGATTLLTNPSDVIAYELRSFATTPKSISDTYVNEVISLGDIISRSAENSQAVVQPTVAALTAVFDRIYGAGNAIIDVSVEQINAALYSLIISIQVFYNNQTYAISYTTQVNNGILVLPNDSVALPVPS